jgi:hypothetical protein
MWDPSSITPKRPSAWSLKNSVADRMNSPHRILDSTHICFFQVEIYIIVIHVLIMVVLYRLLRLKA